MHGHMMCPCARTRRASFLTCAQAAVKASPCANYKSDLSSVLLALAKKGLLDVDGSDEEIQEEAPPLRVTCCIALHCAGVPRINCLLRP